MRWTRKLARGRTLADADGEAVWSRRPDAGVKSARKFLRATVARKPGHRGEHDISRKPPRRESRIASAGPVCSCAFFLFRAHETAGAARIRLSLHPLLFWRVAIDAKLGRIAPRDREFTSAMRAVMTRSDRCASTPPSQPKRSFAN
jgi:hypothetical protein